VAQIDHAEGDEMSAHEVHVLVVISNEQGAKLVNPGKGAFTGKTLFVDIGIE